MFILLLLIVGTIVVLAGLITAGSLFLQATLYNQPTAGIFWRGPAAGAALGLFIGLWLLLARGSPDGRYQTLFNVNTSDSTRFEELSIPARDGNKQVYKATREKNNIVYRLDGRPGEKTWKRVPVFFVKEDNQEVEFKADMDAKGIYQPAENKPLAYRDARGRVIYESDPGEIKNFRWGQFFVAMLINLGLFVLLLAALWLLLEFHFWHAFGLSMVLWIVLILFALPPLLSYAESLGGN